VHGENKHAGLRNYIENLAGSIEPIEIGHADIHQGQVGAQLSRFFNCLATIHGFTADFPSRMAFDQRANATPNNFVIIGN
jgi:hypothetical protein